MFVASQVKLATRLAPIGAMAVDDKDSEALLSLLHGMGSASSTSVARADSDDDQAAQDRRKRKELIRARTRDRLQNSQASASTQDLVIIDGPVININAPDGS